MPGVSLLEWTHRNAEVKIHTSATDFLIETHNSLRQKEISATIISAHALGYAQAERTRLREFLHIDQQQRIVGQGEYIQPSVYGFPQGKNFWLTLWATSAASAAPELQLVASCLSWQLGDYPIFLWSPNDLNATVKSELDDHTRMIQAALVDVVSPRRVFSVFGRKDLVETFSTSWTTRTGFNSEPDPFYTALLSYCAKSTFNPLGSPMPLGDTVRMAGLPDLEPLALLCKEFADESVYFPLTLEGGREEARWLIERNLVWLYEARGIVVSICAAARRSENVAVLTKVYTTPGWRRNGYAERLARKVTEELLSTKTFVALYVGTHNNAQHIYDRIGFTGLCGKPRPRGVEDVLEIGFRSADRGYW